ncbi:MAG: NfeD family protein [Candidatus Kapabacteria bacterium]|nr:NfeD family protein [Candidatus Kapabacteria bacterium]
MLTLFLVCLIIGGGLLAFSLLSGTHDSSNLDHSADFQMDSEINVEGDINTEGHFSVEPTSAHIESHNFEAAETVKFFSLRNFIYFLTFFGLTGTLLTLFDINSIVSLLSSLGIGVLSYLFGYKLMKYFKTSETGEIINIYSLIGRTGKVELDIIGTNKGKILVNVGGRLIELIAMKSETDDSDSFKSGEEVLITDIQNNIAIVEKVDF